LGTPNLEVFEGSVEDVVIVGEGPPGSATGPRVEAVLTSSGDVIACGQVVVTTGTFLRGKCYLGEKSYAAGRHIRDTDDKEEVEQPSVGLALTLERLKIPLGRMKTGTPPRLSAKSINYGILEPQPSEDPFVPFSYMNAERLWGAKHSGAGATIQCHKTYTNEATHEVRVRRGWQVLGCHSSIGLRRKFLTFRVLVLMLKSALFVLTAAFPFYLFLFFSFSLLSFSPSFASISLFIPFLNFFLPLSSRWCGPTLTACPNTTASAGAATAPGTARRSSKKSSGSRTAPGTWSGSSPRA
jgi:hypothetical protein